MHSIHLAAQPTAPMTAAAEARLIEGVGIDGDRYATKTGSYSARPGSGREVTLIELEAIRALEREDGITLDPGAARRNIVTEGVPLNHLVGREFAVGEVVLRGTRLCEPCGHLQRLVGIDGLATKLLHRAGLRTEVVAGGTIRPGDRVEPL